uniref:recombinase family protein n=1 Tax=Arthrobacter sp. TaxID=1667 RepID=UPI000EB70AB7|nr:recombinase family protein [Arthrobacter sp.]AXV46404.1 serine resolvase, DNA invertase [Arthrobacter sp.]
MAKVGYARVLANDENTDGQIDALIAAGVSNDVQHLFVDEGSSNSKAPRPAFDRCLDSLREGDILVVAKFARLGRSLANLIELMRKFDAIGVSVQILDNPALNTYVPEGLDKDAAQRLRDQTEYMLGILGSLAQYERALILDRTRVGLESARARGRNGGRPAVSSDDPKVKRAKDLHSEGKLTPQEIAGSLKIGVSTLYRYIKM